MTKESVPFVAGAVFGAALTTLYGKLKKVRARLMLMLYPLSLQRLLLSMAFQKAASGLARALLASDPLSRRVLIRVSLYHRRAATRKEHVCWVLSPHVMHPLVFQASRWWTS